MFLRDCSQKARAFKSLWCFPCNEPILSLDLQARIWTSFKNIIKKLSGFPTPIWHYLRLDLWITQISACLRMYNIHKCHHAGNLWLKKMRNIENYFDDQILKFQMESEYDHLRSACLKDFIKLLKITHWFFWQEVLNLGHVGEHIWMIVIEWDLLYRRGWGCYLKRIAKKIPSLLEE